MNETDKRFLENGGGTIVTFSGPDVAEQGRRLQEMLDDLMKLMGVGPSAEFRVLVDNAIGAIVIEVHVGDVTQRVHLMPPAAEQLAYAIHESLCKLRRWENEGA